MVDKKIDIGNDNSGIANSGDGNTITQNIGNIISDSFNNIHNSQITIKNPITDKTLNRIIDGYEQTVNDLKAQLEKAPSPQKQLELYQKLEQAQNELQTKTQEILKLQETLKSIQPDEEIATRAKEIFETKGIEQAIEYLSGVEFDKQKDLADKYMQNTAKALNVKAEFLVIQNRYDEAKEAYKQMTQYDRSFDALFEYALFLQNQNHFQEAIKGYENLLDLELSQEDRALTLNNLAILYSDQNQHQKALQAYQEALNIHRDLAQANPSVYNPDVANTLNNLAILYRAQNQHQKALQAYQEALNIHRDLAQANPSVYNPDVANTLNNLAILYKAQNQNKQALQVFQEALKIRRDLAQTNPRAYELYYVNTLLVGVDYLKQDKKGLEEAKKIVTQKHYRDVYWATQLLAWIERIEKR